MESSFWHQRWADNDIGFHQPEANPLLIKHLPTLSLTNGARLFLPLCGKSLDIHWLLQQGYRVVGVELSERAVVQLFEELGVTPEVIKAGELRHYRADALDVFVGDIFSLDAGLLGPVDAIYDRAALVALPASMREAYCQHLARLTASAPQLLISFEYDQQQMPGPPFAVDDAMIRAYYSGRYTGIDCIDQVPVAGGLKGLCPAKEAVWWLR